MAEADVTSVEQKLGARGRLLLRAVEPRLRRRLLDVLLEPDEPRKLTYAEFLDWIDEDTHAEWVDGEVVMTSPASDEHQDIADFLTTLLRIFVHHHGLGWVRSAPFQMKTGPGLPGREPDIVFLTSAHAGRLTPTYIDGPADLAVEIVSPESASRDRGEKPVEYAQGGVAEYWLIDPLRRWADFYRLEGDRYAAIFAGSEGEFQSRVLPGFRLRVEWLWRRPKPSEVDVLRDLGVLR
ncbi:hypothetical protein DCC79_02665 [bacterium]|nr:Uma2 family endonuclease [Chloroflexi bacterium CFX6]RIL12090.1 MAG: hypothetical protein DCC79_02665 [bacterium]